MGAKPQVKSTANRDQACVWMQAGIVRRKQCRLNYACTECRFDRALRKAARKNRRLARQGAPLAGKRARIVTWEDRLRERPLAKRPCVHTMKGRITFRPCTHEYSCGNCEFDQFFFDQYSVHAVVRPVDVLEVEGFRIPQGYYLHTGHAWVKVEDNAMVRVGIDDFALRLLGPLDRIETPLFGKTVHQGAPGMKLCRGEQNAALLSPVNGVVTDINPAIREDGGLANRAPYSDGWIMRVHAADLRKDLDTLMIGAETTRFIEAAVDRLYQVIEENAPLAADGGQLGHDIFGSLPGLEWNRLVTAFLTGT